MRPQTDVLILCGGLGTRLEPLIPDRPKSLAPIQGRPFLDIIVGDLTRQGFRRIIFCVGRYKEQIVERYATRRDAEFLFSPEDVPLGTGGAIRQALPLAASDLVLIMNGDSFCRVDFDALHGFHREHEAEATLVLTSAVGRTDGGLVRVDDAGRIQSFAEKAGRGDGGYLSAGIYLVNVQALGMDDLEAPFSLEYDVFPRLVHANRCFGFVVQSPVIDIGTPERFRSANAGADFPGPA